MSATAFSKKDRFKETSREEIIVNGDVQAGSVEETTITADSNEIWEVIGARVFASSDSDATSGTHQMGYVPASNIGTLGNILFTVEASYNEEINLENGFVFSGSINNFSGDAYQALDAFRGTLIDDSNGIKGIYQNDTDAIQENDRIYNLFVHKWEA